MDKPALAKVDKVYRVRQRLYFNPHIQTVHTAVYFLFNAVPLPLVPVWNVRKTVLRTVGTNHSAVFSHNAFCSAFPAEYLLSACMHFKLSTAVGTPIKRHFNALRTFVIGYCHFGSVLIRIFVVA